MIGIIIFTITALLLGIILVYFDSKFGFEKEEKVTSYLPGYNCGKCGFSGCQGLAEEILKNPEEYKKCNFMKEENITALKEYLKQDD